jgi:hypothetical protein
MKKATNQVWAAVHWLGAVQRLGTEKDVRSFCRKNSFNTKHPIYYAVPIYGIRNIECDKCAGKGRLIIEAKA